LFLAVREKRRGNLKQDGPSCEYKAGRKEKKRVQYYRNAKGKKKKKAVRACTTRPLPKSRERNRGLLF